MGGHRRTPGTHARERPANKLSRLTASPERQERAERSEWLWMFVPGSLAAPGVHAVAET